MTISLCNKFDIFFYKLRTNQDLCRATYREKRKIFMYISTIINQ